MVKARVVKMGKDQVVLFPKKFRLKTKEVEIFRRGNEIVIREKYKGLEKALFLIAELAPDAVRGIRAKPDRPQKRKGL
jgi:antitoxin VapB